MESCTNVPRRRKIIIKIKKKRTTTPSEYEDGETSSPGEETTASEETTVGGETTVSEETSVASEETTVETTTIDANASTINPNATTLHTNSTTGNHNSTTIHPNSTTIHPNSTTKETTLTTTTFTTVNGTISTTTTASTSTSSTTASTASSTTSTASTTTTTFSTTTTPAPNCSTDMCLAINCSQSNPQPSSSEVQVSSVLNGNQIPRRMVFTNGETCNKAYKIISGSASGNYESAFRVCCLLKMNVLSIDTPDKFTCISSMLKSMGSMSWYVWTSARQRNCNGSYVWCTNPWTEVNATLWSPGFPVAYNASTNGAPCVSLNVNYVNNTAVTTLENSACDFMNTIICE